MIPFRRKKFLALGSFIFFVGIIFQITSACVQEITPENSQQIDLPTEFSCLPSPSDSQTARVFSVIDGDTIKIQLGDNKINVRYIGINAPELDSEEREIAEEALKFNQQLVENQTVTLYRDTSETDRFGRLLRYVFVGDLFINYEMVRMGYARQRDYPPDSACKHLFIQAQEEAISQRRGIWKSE